MALAFAPFECWPVLFLSIPVFFTLLDAAQSPRHAVARGFLFGYGYFMAGTWWIANALTVDMAKFGWLIPFCVLGLSAAMAVYFALFGWLYSRLRTASPYQNFGWFVLLWVVVEYLRSLGMFGFPWNLVGYVTLASVSVAQLASVVGVFGLSLLVMVVAISPAAMLHARTPRARAGIVLMPVVLLAAAYGYGAARLPNETALSETTVRIVQPNIAQDIKGGPEWEMQSARALSELSAHGKADVTVWPETAYPLPVRGNRIALLKPSSGILLTGALRVEGERETLRIYNSIIAVDGTGLLLAAYDKHQLVPFGEFVPLRSVLPLDKITPGSLDFSRGAGAQSILLRDVPAFSPLVCYEVVFPWMAVDAAHRPAWIVNMTNDGWYGDSAGPYQHLAMTRMRAIEQGLPLVRVANTGISAMIDPYGRVTALLPLGARGATTAPLPQPMSATVYARNGEMSVLLLLSGIFLCLFTFGRRKK